MKKILNNPETLAQFQTDRKTLTQLQLVDKYSVSRSTITRLIKRIDTINEENSESNEEQNEPSESNSELSEPSEPSEPSVANNESSEEQSESNEEQSVSSEVNNESNEEQIEPNESIEQCEQSIVQQVYKAEQEQLNESAHSLVEYLNKSQKSEKSIKSVKNKNIKKEERVQTNKIQQQEKAQPKQQPVQQIDIQPSHNDNPSETPEIQAFHVKIRKLIQFFPNEECIHPIIGSTEQQQRKFCAMLHTKSLDEIALLHKSIQFELLFSRSNTFIGDTIEQVARFGEKAMSVIGIDVVGVYDSMSQDPEFQFYLKMLIAESSYIPSAKQIIFMKFVKTYYLKYTENKGKKNDIFNTKMKEKVDDDLLNRINCL